MAFSTGVSITKERIADRNSYFDGKVYHFTNNGNYKMAK